METSRKIARILGPVLIAIGSSEILHLRSGVLTHPPAAAGLIYLNGGMLFAAGVAIIQSHNIWKGWPIFITLVGWLFTLGGLVRMFVPSSGQSEGSWVYLLCLVLLVIGIILFYQGFLWKKSK